MKTYNPDLTPASADKGGEASIEHPDRVENIGWQTRKAPPMPDEVALADALQAIFDEEIYDLPRIVERLQARVAPPQGLPRWTAELLCAELARLGA